MPEMTIKELARICGVAVSTVSPVNGMVMVFTTGFVSPGTITDGIPPAQATL